MCPTIIDRKALLHPLKLFVFNIKKVIDFKTA